MTVTEQEITDYVARVRAALADLPPGQRDELTEDLADHLTEVAAEAEGTLVERLGEPETYAAELRAAAGAAAGAAGAISTSGSPPRWPGSAAGCALSTPGSAHPWGTRRRATSSGCCARPGGCCAAIWRRCWSR